MRRRLIVSGLAVVFGIASGSACKKETPTEASRTANVTVTISPNPVPHSG